MARILLVEDDPALSRGIIALLKAAGHAADSAKDGETALFLADADPAVSSYWISACPTYPDSRC